MKTIRIAIVGGGLAGLTAAHFLKKINTAFSGSLCIDAAVFEVSDQLGADLASRRNFTVTDTEREILSLVRELNIEIRPLVVDTSKEALSELMKIIVREILYLRSKRIIEKSQDWSAKNNDILNKLDAISIVEFFVQKGKEVSEVRALLESSLIAVYADDFDQLSALDTMRFMSPYIHCKTFYSIKDGLGALTQALVNTLNEDKQCIFMRRTVTDIKLAMNDQWCLSFKNSPEQTFDYVVMSDPQQYLKKNGTPYFKPGQRHLIGQADASNNNGLFFAEEFVTASAPSSMNSAVKSAYHVICYELVPMIYAALPDQDEELTPAVEMAVFSSGNDAQLETSLT